MQCAPIKNIAYLKAHKTASSSIQRILFRYGIKHDLHFAIPKEGNYFNPTKNFKAVMLPKKIMGDFEINIFAMHNSWDFNEVVSVMPNNTIFLASLRQPIDQFRSLFTFIDFTKSTKMTMDEYVKNTINGKKRLYGMLGYNQMSFDFGILPNDLDDEKKIKRMIAEADQLFDLVLIYEKINESLVLLKNLLCWDYDDVAMLKVNSREEQTILNISSETKKLLEEREHSDILLYNHFREKLDKAIEAFGHERMKAELKELEKAKLRLTSNCNITQKTSNKINDKKIKAIKKDINVFLGNVDDPNCFPYILNEQSLIDYVRQKQIKKVNKFLLASQKNRTTTSPQKP